MMQPNSGNVYRLGLVDLTADKQATEGEIVQSVVAESVPQKHLPIALSLHRMSKES